ncbi:MAG: choice-of-anchor D domain-containing protein, partial [Caldimonas sp.]
GSASQTLAGTVTINLNDAGARFAIEGNGSTTLGAGVTVRGQGNIGTANNVGGANLLTNNGLISADVAGGTLNIVPPGNSGSFVNNGTLQAINGATLLLSTDILAHAGSQIVSGAGSTVQQNGIRINGVFASSGGGAFTAVSSAGNFLDGVNFTGVLDLGTIANARERIINGATINGAVNVANGGILSMDSASGSASQTLAGTVTINLNDPGARFAIDGNGSTTLGSGVTVRGQGNIGTPINVGGTNLLTNNGLISADVTGGTLNIVAPGNSGSFVNNGTLQAINGANLLLSTDILAQAGSQIVAGLGSSVTQNGVRVNGVISTSGGGVFNAASSAGNYLDAVNFTGSLDLGSIANARERIVNGGTINGAVNVANGGILSMDSSAGTAIQTLSGNATINLNDAGARFAIDGNGTTTLASGVTVRGQGNIGTAINVGGTNTLVNNGLISADVSGGTLVLAPPGNSGSVVNNSNLQATNGGALMVTTNVTNTSGLISALAGSAVVLSGVTIDGGALSTSGTGVIRAISSSTNYLSGVAITGTLDLTTFANSRERIVNGATINGTVNVANGGILSFDSANTTGANQTILGTGVIRLNDAGARLAVDGNGTTTLSSTLTVRGQGTIGQAINVGGTNTLVNNGLILADGGTLQIAAPGNSGVLAGTGTLQIGGGALNLATLSDSTQGKLLIGAAGSTLNLGGNNLILTNDYTNAQSGTGNAFDRRAGVSGAGKILAGGNATQVITGANVSNGTTANATLTLGNMRVGTTTYDYQVANVGMTGPTLRGAIQTNVNGASLTDARLSGTGVTAGNYVTGAPGSSTGSLAVTFAAANAGALAPLSGQSINLRSNFENIADQKLNIVFANGASAYNAAIGSATTPVQVANQRIGGSNTAGVTIANTALAGSFSEDLNASVGATTGMATGIGSISGRVAGTNNTGVGAINVGVDTTAAGARTGTVTVNYQTAGTVNGVSNGLAAAGVGSQAVTVNGNVYQAATGAIQTSALNFGTVQVGQVVNQGLVIRNTATGPAGFVEDLNASFGSATGTGASLLSGAGSLSGILAGANSTNANGTMTVTVNTSAAGVVNGGIAVNYQTAGAVNGISNGLGTAAAGSQSYGVAGTIQTTGNVINQASPLINNPSIDLGAVRVGAVSPTANVSLTNQATPAPQAALSATIASNGMPVTVGGSVTLLAPGATSSNQLQVGLDTSTAGNFTGANAGSATLSLVSDASNVGNCAPNCQLALASQQVSVSGKVYTPAVAQVNTTVVDFGIVHTGEAVAGRSVSVTNAAAATALNDTMSGTFGSATGSFTAAGALNGLAAQGTDTGSFVAGITTTAAGIFTGSASVALQSHDADLADVSLGSTTVTLKGQVNNYAEASLIKTGGSFALTHVGSVYTIDFGSLMLGVADVSESLAVLNSAMGPADLLHGTFDTSGVGTGFLLSAFGPFSGLSAGDSQSGYAITFDSAVAGSFTDTIILHAFGNNASGYDAAIGDTTIVLRGDVIGTVAAVPEPETYALMLAGLMMVGGVARARRKRAGPATR